MNQWIEVRREKAEKAWGLKDEIVLIGAGEPIHIPGGADQCFPYKPHPDFRWLAEKRREGGVLAFDPQDGWELFEPIVTETERVWGGGEPPEGRPLSELEGWLHARKGRSIATLGSYFHEETESQLSQFIGEALLHARRSKDQHEIELVKRAVAATAVGHAAAKEIIRPGLTERQIQIELEYGFMRGGADGLGYASIVGTGADSAIFHFTPGAKTVQDDDFVLIDAGAEVDGYVADVTRTYAASEQFSPEKQDIYDAVKLSLERSIKICRVGTEWLDVHLTAARSLAESLQSLGYLRCSPDEAIESECIAMFLPHGIGHMVGLGVRDASGALPGRDRPNRVAGIRIRMDIPLQEGYLVTVEPGLYFSEAILTNTERREQYRDMVNWGKVDPWIGHGGVRLEDDVLISSEGCINLTNEIPK